MSAPTINSIEVDNSGSDTELTVNATVPDGTSASVFVLEDTDSDGAANNEVEQAIEDGTNTHTLSALDGDPEHIYWTHSELEPGEVLTIDNFEEEPDGPYGSNEDLPDYYGGFDDQTLTSVDGSIYEIQTTVVNDGQRALEMSDDSFATGVVSHTDDGLPRYPQQGETWEVRLYLETDSSGLIWFGVPLNDTPRDNSYRVQIGAPEFSTTFSIGKFSGGSFTQLASSETTFPKEEWLRVEIEWTDTDDINVSVDNASGTEEDSLSVNDSDANIESEGGIGWASDNDNTNVSCYLDDSGVL